MEKKGRLASDQNFGGTGSYFVCFQRKLSKSIKPQRFFTLGLEFKACLLLFFSDLVMQSQDPLCFHSLQLFDVVPQVRSSGGGSGGGGFL